MQYHVLNSPSALKAGVYVVRAFVKLREMLSGHKELARKLEELESKLEKHDHEIMALVEAIRQLMAPAPQPQRRRIGFATEMEA